MSEPVQPFVVTNTQARRISIAGQDIDPGQTSKPIQVLGGKNPKGDPIKPGEINPDATAIMVERVKDSPMFKAKWLVEGAVSLPPPPPRAKPSNLEGVEDAKALILIKIETDIPTLATWAEAENQGAKRKPLLEAIGARAAAIQEADRKARDGQAGG